MEVWKILLVIILSIGATQGVAFGIILWQSRYEDASSKYQAILLLVLAYGLLIQVLRLFGIGYYDALYHLTLDLNWTYGPLFYLFVKSKITPGFRFDRSDRWLLLPVILQVVCSIYVRQQNFFWDGTRDSLTWLGYWGYAYWMNYSTVPIIASLLIMFFSWRLWWNLQQLETSEVYLSNLIWLKRLVGGYGIYYTFVLVILVTDLVVYVVTVDSWYFYFTRFFYYPFFIGEAVLLYWFGISSIIRKDQQVLKPRKVLSNDERLSLEPLADRLETMILEEELYRNAGLSIADVADKLDTKPYIVTKVLNEFLQISFTDYINQKRVMAVKEMLKNPKNDRYTLLGLAYDAGFNSKSSFNRAVQKHLGVSPSDLRKS